MIGTKERHFAPFVQNGTKLVLSRDGFAQVDEAYEQACRNWVDFLASLKSHLETGKGTPGSPPNFK